MKKSRFLGRGVKDRRDRRDRVREPTVVVAYVDGKMIERALRPR